MKEQQKKHIIEMMQQDEELGLYEEILGKKAHEYSMQYAGTDKYTVSMLAIEFGYHLALEQQEKSYSEEKVICKHCQKPISVNDINNHLFMNIKGGGLIHWNCETI